MLFLMPPASRLAFCLAVMATVARGGEPLQTGTLFGTVQYMGPQPAVRTVEVTDGSTIQHCDLLVDPKTKGLRYVFAMLEDAPNRPPLQDAKPVVMDQVDWIFKPRVVAVQHGQAVRFENNDSFNHSVMAMSPLLANQMNSVAGPGMPIERAFEPQKHPISIGCALHPWMQAWVYVVRHPWFAVSDERGNFEIKDIPPGRYRLLLAHADGKLREQRSVEIAAGKAVALKIQWPPVGKPDGN